MGICISHWREASHHVQRSLIQQALFGTGLTFNIFLKSEQHAHTTVLTHICVGIGMTLSQWACSLTRTAYFIVVARLDICHTGRLRTATILPRTCNFDYSWNDLNFIL